MVLSVCTCWFHNMVTLPPWLVSTDFGTCSYQSFLSSCTHYYYYHHHYRIKYILLRAKTANTKFSIASTHYVLSMICIIFMMMYIIRNILVPIYISSEFSSSSPLCVISFDFLFHMSPDTKNYLGFPGTWSQCTSLISYALFLLHTSILTV
jgi:hypothetical protein